MINQPKQTGEGLKPLALMLLLMNCLIGYIGLNACKGSAPESGLYINELPGINLQSIDKIADSDQQTYARVWDDVQKRSVRKLHADVSALFAKRYRIKTVSDSVQLSRKVEADVVNLADEWRGITIELSDAGSQYLPSALQVIHLQKLEAYFSGASDIEFNVIDLDTGELLETFTQAVATGWNTIALNKDYAASRIFIGYDASAINSVTILLPKAYDCSCHLIADWGYDCCQGQIKGAIYDDSTGDITAGTNTFGVSAIVGVHCRYDAIVCNSKAVFANALWYLLGAEMMTERIYSDRLNRYTTVDRNRAIEMRNEFREQYIIELEKAVDGINLNHFDCCLECAAQLKYEEATL